MKLGMRMIVGMAGIALAATLAFGEDAFAPYGEDFTRGEAIPREQLRMIEHAKPLLAPQQGAPRAADSRQRAPRKKPEPASTPVQAVQGAPLPKTGL